MNDDTTRNLPARLEGVRRRFERWRGTRRTRSRIPDALWAAAAKVAGRYGVCRTARALRVDYYALKKRLVPAAAVAPTLSAAGAVATFLELPPPACAGVCECTLELEDAGGAKMRVHLKGAGPAELAALSRSFWEPRP
jgi:hypothetical protein